MNNAIEIRNLEFSYGPSATAPLLSISNFSMPEQSHYFIHGESGSGKSTFLNLISGILTPSSGDIIVCGENLGKLQARSRDHLRGLKLGVIFQQFNLVGYLSALENIKLPAAFHKIPHIDERARQLMAMLDIEAIMHQKASTLSLGQQQRVAAARALVGQPELVIADEPTSSLDEKNTERFLKGLFDVAKASNAAILLVSHDKTIATHFQKNISLTQLQQAKHHA